MEERRELFARALELSMKDSVRVWLADRFAFTPYRVNGKVHRMKIAMPGLLVGSWNPIAGSNWNSDMSPIRSTADWGLMFDPNTSLLWPQRIERAEVYVLEGLPVTKTLDWVDLEFVPEIKVPEDAWIDWDAAAQKFITVGEKYPEGLTARRKSVVYYPWDLWNIKLHDGSTLDLADFIMGMILTFDWAKEGSTIYDEAYVPAFESFMEHFRGVRIVQEDPLVIETYSDLYYLDAEWNVVDWFPYYAQGPGFWHTLAIGILAEANKELAFSPDKAEKLGVEWMSYIAGPSIDILKGYLEKAIAERYIPFEEVLGRWITPDEAVARYEALKKWVEEKGHFWVGDGPFYVDSVDTLARTVTLKRFEAFRDPAEKWLRFAEPKIAEVEALAPAVITIGEGAVIPVDITYKGEPYPPEEIDFVKYLLFDAEGKLVLVGEAEYLSGPTWVVTLTSEDTAKLIEGSSKLLVVVSSKVVVIPGYDEVEFVVLPVYSYEGAISDLFKATSLVQRRNPHSPGYKEVCYGVGWGALTLGWFATAIPGVGIAIAGGAAVFGGLTMFYCSL